MMKHFKTLVLFVASVAIISCSEDDSNNTPVDAQTLVGTWAMTVLQADTQASGTAVGIPFNSVANTVGSNFDFTITFTESTYSASGSYDLTTTGTINGEPLDSETETIIVENEMGTYTIENGQIIFGDTLFLEDELPDDPSLDVDFNITTNIDGNGNLVIEQNVDFDIMETGEFPANLSTAVAARIVFTRVE